MSCAPRVAGILNKVPGVEKAEVDFDTKTATIECSGAVTPEILEAAVAKSGQYSLQPKN